MIAKDLDLDSLCATFEICPRFLPVLEKQRESIVPLVEGGDVTLNRDFQGMEALLRSGKDTYTMDQFVARYNSHLSPSLRFIFFNPNFPVPPRLRFSQSDTQNTHVTPQEILENNEAFTAQITDILKALSIIERGIQHSYSWRSCILNPAKLPKVECITTLSFGTSHYCMFAYGRRYICERTAIDLCYALPNLEVIDYSADTEGPPQVTISQNLVSMDLRIIADGTLFWPSAAENLTTPFWPRLQHLNVMFHPSTPTGSSYLEEVPHYEGFDEPIHSIIPRGPIKWSSSINSLLKMYHPAPVEEAMEPFLQAFGRALGAMPSMQSANVETWATCSPRHHWFLDAAVPNLPPHKAPMRRCVKCHRWGVTYLNRPSKKPYLEWQVGD
ncbi:hypothetical protein A7D00_2304 [Trichophyton violaceum]|uniref:Uncharacterized protein n=1 Tax=Trichophyton violaceum TaxID=34388 RepID=A0A178FP44_TRIVO|nr:hypothetical protein A7D00_2304 [Trichophyton violaceum]